MPKDKDRITTLLELVLTGVTMLLLIQQGKEEGKDEHERDPDIIRVISAFVDEERRFLGDKFKFVSPKDGGE